MSNFSFSYSVFKRLLLQTRKNQGLFGKRLNPFSQIPYVYLLFVLAFYTLKKSELNSAKKEFCIILFVLFVTLENKPHFLHFCDKKLQNFKYLKGMMLI